MQKNTKCLVKLENYEWAFFLLFLYFLKFFIFFEIICPFFGGGGGGGGDGTGVLNSGPCTRCSTLKPCPLALFFFFWL
jgi:hypothetical protein